MANSLELPGGIKMLNPVPIDPRSKVTNLASIANDPTYYVGFSPIYNQDGGGTFKISGGTASSGWIFRQIEIPTVNVVEQGNPSPVTSDAVAASLLGKVGKDELVSNNLVFDSNLQDTAPANGKFKFVGTSQQQSSVVLVSSINNRYVGIDNFGSIAIGSKLYFETIGEIMESLSLTVESVINEGAYYRIGFTRSAQTNDFVNESEVALVLQSAFTGEIGEAGFTQDVVLTWGSMNSTAQAAKIAEIAALPSNMNGYNLIITFASGTPLYIYNSIRFDNFQNGNIIIEAATGVSVAGTSKNTIIYYDEFGEDLPPLLVFNQCQNVNAIVDSINFGETSPDVRSSLFLFQNSDVKVLSKYNYYNVSTVQTEYYLFHGCSSFESRMDAFRGVYNNITPTHAVRLSNDTDNNLAGMAFCYDAVFSSDPFTSFATGNGICAVKNSSGVFTDVVNPGSNVIDLLKSVVNVPSIISSGIENITETSFNFISEFNRAGSIYYGIYLDSDPVPTVAEIIAGSGAVVFDSITTEGFTTETANITGLTAAVDYRIYFLGIDSLENNTLKQVLDVRTDLLQLNAVDYNIYLEDVAELIVNRVIPNSEVNPVGTTYNHQIKYPGSSTFFNGLNSALSVSGNMDFMTGTFEYRVRAEGDGINTLSSPWSEIKRFTSGGTILNTPTLNAPVMGDTSAYFTWTDPNFPTNETEVVIVHNIVGGAASDWVETILPANTTAGTVPGLVNNTAYEFRIIARGDNVTLNDSQISAVVTGTTQLPLPAAPTPVLGISTITSDRILLTYLDSEPFSDNGMFRLEWSADGSTNWTFQTNLSEDDTSYNVLVPSSTLRYFRIRQLGNQITSSVSAWSNVVSGTTLDVLNAITDLAADPGDTYVQLNWTDVNTTESSTLIEYREVGSPTWLLAANIADNVAQYLHEGLATETNYEYRVTPQGTEGVSEDAPSATVSTTTLAASGLPYLNPVTNLVATPGTYDVQLDWDDTNTGESGTLVEYRILGDPDWLFDAYLNVNITTLTHTGLTHSTDYEFRVAPQGVEEVSEAAPWVTIQFTTGAYVATPPTAIQIRLIGTFAVGRTVSMAYYYNDPEPQTGSLYRLIAYADETAADADTNATGGVLLASGVTGDVEYVNNLMYVIQEAEMALYLRPWVQPISSLFSGIWTGGAVSSQIMPESAPTEMLSNTDLLNATGWTVTGGVTIGSGAIAYDGVTQGDAIKPEVEMVAPIQRDKLYKALLTVTGASATGVNLAIKDDRGVDYVERTNYVNGVYELVFHSNNFYEDGPFIYSFQSSEAGSLSNISLKLL